MGRYPSNSRGIDPLKVGRSVQSDLLEERVLVPVNAASPSNITSLPIRTMLSSCKSDEDERNFCKSINGQVEL